MRGGGCKRDKELGQGRGGRVIQGDPTSASEAKRQRLERGDRMEGAPGAWRAEMGRRGNGEEPGDGTGPAPTCTGPGWQGKVVLGHHSLVPAHKKGAEASPAPWEFTSPLCHLAWVTLCSLGKLPRHLFNLFTFDVNGTRK